MDGGVSRACSNHEFTPPHNEENATTLNEASVGHETSPPHRPLAATTENVGFLWAPVRRLICRGLAKAVSTSRPPSQLSFHRKSPQASSTLVENPPRCPFCDERLTPAHREQVRVERSKEQRSKSAKCSPAAAASTQLSGMFSPAVSNCLRVSCSSPRRRKLRRNCSNNMRSPVCRSPKRPQRRRVRRVRKPRRKKKPPWMEQYRVSADVWKFLKEYRQQSPCRNLQDLLQNSMSHYASGSSRIDEINLSSSAEEEQDCEESDGDATDGTFRDAASIARSLATEESAMELPSIHPRSSTPLSLISEESASPAAISRMCNASCKSPSSVCMQSRNVTGLQSPVDCCTGNGYTMIGPNSRRNRCGVQNSLDGECCRGAQKEGAGCSSACDSRNSSVGSSWKNFEMKLNFNWQ